MIKMSDSAQRVLIALMEYSNINYRSPIQTIREFFDDKNIGSVSEDYESLTDDEEKQIIQEFLELAY